jgi:serine/threonine protein kinase
VVDESEDTDETSAELALSVVDRGSVSEPLTWTLPGDAGLVDQLRRIRVLARAFETCEPSTTVRGVCAPAASVGRWGEFDLIEEIGRGGYGTVYRAWDPALKREIALKLLPREADHEEGARLARVRHPNVVTVYGAAVHDGVPGIWMELVRGRTLAAVLTEGPVAPDGAVTIGVEVSRALAAVHAAGLVHQDVKASNVMICEDGRILLMDFGSGMASARGHPPRRLSGTPLYMAPEVLLGGAPSPRSDVYAVGVLIYLLLAGTYPVYAPTLEELRQRHRRYGAAYRLRGSATVLRQLRPEVPGALARCVARAVAPAERRFESADALAAALQRVQKATRSGRSATLLTAIALAACFVFALLWSDSSPRPGPQAELPRDGAAQSLQRTAFVPVAGAARTGPPNATLLPRPPGPITPEPETFDIAAGLYVTGETGDRRLRSGDRVSAGDALVLRVECSRPVYLYVANEDERGSATLLFPLPACRQRNPLSAGRRHTLPGRCGDGDVAWQVSSSGGRERLLVVASARRLLALEERLALLPLPAWGGRRSLDALVRTPGTPARMPSLQELAALARSEPTPTERATGVWVEEIVLQNPDDHTAADAGPVAR